MSTEQVQKIIKVLFLENEQPEDIVWDSWHRKTIATITKGMNQNTRSELYNEVLYEIDLIQHIQLTSKQKQAIRRLIFTKGKLKQEQDEEVRILSKGF